MGRHKKNLNEPVSLVETENNLNEDTSKQSIDAEVKAEKIDGLINDYKETETGQKAKRQRKPKEENKDAEQFAELATIQASIALEIIVARMPRAQPLSDKERENFDKAFTLLAQKYYENVKKYGAEIQFIAALGLILIPRIDFKKIIDNVRKNNTNIRENRNGKDNTYKTNSETIPFKEKNSN